jgi:predicted NACHT family NTPase
MLSSDRMSLNYREFPDRIRRLFGSVVQEEKDLDHWHYDMMGQTMLIRNADGDYMPAHRSLLEFFVAYKFAAELGALAPDFLELAQMQSCLDSSAEPQDYTWSAYFQRTLDETGRSVAIAPLRSFISEDLERLRLGFGRNPLTKAVINLLVPMLIPVTSSPSHPLVKSIEATRGKVEAEVGYVGGNSASLLVNINKFALERRDLNRTVIIGADLSYASLRNVNFTETNLTSSAFARILSSVMSVEFNPDGNLLATGDADGIVRLWEAVSGREILVCKEHDSWINSVTFSPCGCLTDKSNRDRNED